MIFHGNGMGKYYRTILRYGKNILCMYISIYTALKTENLQEVDMTHNCGNGGNTSNSGITGNTTILKYNNYMLFNFYPLIMAFCTVAGIWHCLF